MHGVNILTGEKVTSMSFDRESKSWRVQTEHSGEAEVARSQPGALLVPQISESSTKPAQISELSAKPACNGGGSSHHAKVVINCAGLFGDDIERMRIESIGGEHILQAEIPFHVTPRKGQFVVFNQPAVDESKKINQITPPKYIIEPVASQFTKGIIVWTTVYGNVVVGPTAVDQTDKTDRSTDKATVERLRRHAEKVIPSLRHATVLGTYSGLRPSTQHRDYQIYPLPDEQWITVGGIRSTGLSAASGIGEYVGQLYADMMKTVPVKNKNMDSQMSMGITEASMSPLDVLHHPSQPAISMKMPKLNELAASYRALNSRNEECQHCSDEQRNQSNHCCTHSKKTASMNVEIFGTR